MYEMIGERHHSCVDRTFWNMHEDVGALFCYMEAQQTRTRFYLDISW